MKEYIDLKEKNKQTLANKEAELCELHTVVKAAQLEAELAKQNAADNPAPDQDRIDQLIVEQEQIKANRLAALQEARKAKCLADEAEQGRQKALKELSSDPGYLLKTVERMIGTNKRKATEPSEALPSKREFSMLGKILNTPLITGNDNKGVTYMRDVKPNMCEKIVSEFISLGGIQDDSGLSKSLMFAEQIEQNSPDYLSQNTPPHPPTSKASWNCLTNCSYLEAITCKKNPKRS